MHQFYQDYLSTLEALHEGWVETLGELSVEALDWVPGREMNSLCVLVVHTMGATRYWVGDVVGQIPSNRVRAAEFQAHGLDSAALHKLMDETSAFLRTVLEKLSLEDLAAARVSPNHPGEPFTVGGVLSHALEHYGLHLGHAEITRQLWDHNYGTK